MLFQLALNKTFCLAPPPTTRQQFKHPKLIIRKLGFLLTNKPATLLSSYNLITRPPRCLLTIISWQQGRSHLAPSRDWTWPSAVEARCLNHHATTDDVLGILFFFYCHYHSPGHIALPSCCTRHFYLPHQLSHAIKPNQSTWCQPWALAHLSSSAPWPSNSHPIPRPSCSDHHPK